MIWLGNPNRTVIYFAARVFLGALTRTACPLDIFLRLKNSDGSLAHSFLDSFIHSSISVRDTAWKMSVGNASPCDRDIKECRLGKYPAIWVMDPLSVEQRLLLPSRDSRGRVSGKHSPSTHSHSLSPLRYPFLCDALWKLASHFSTFSASREAINIDCIMNDNQSAAWHLLPSHSSTFTIHIWWREKTS